MPNLPGPPDDPRGPGHLRASDAERERVAETLRRAAGDGRLTVEELNQRLEAAYAARTHAELEPLTRDLPVAGTPGPAPAAMAHRFGSEPTSRLAVALMSGFERAGRWVVPRRFTGIAVMGGGSIDMRDARFAEQVTRIGVLAVMGGIDIVVPPDAQVRARGLGIMGGFGGRRASGAERPSAPIIVVTGLAIMGGVGIRRRPPSGKDADAEDHAGDDEGR
jgi:hypothetical protein